MQGRKRRMTKKRFLFLTFYLNCSKVSREMGQNRMYLTDIRHGKMKYTKEIGYRLRKLLEI